MSARLGLLVAIVLTGPMPDPAHPELGAVSVLTLLPGETLLQWSTCVAPSAQEGIEWLILEAVTRMQHLTAALVHEAVATTLPRRSLLVELHAIRAHAGSWCDVAVCRDAVQQLMPLVAQVQTSLVFSNGDYNPANFLSDGQQLTGFVDFADARFEDPAFGLAKYVTYAWLPFNVARLLQRFRTMCALSPSDWALRVAVACLWPSRIGKIGQTIGTKSCNTYARRLHCCGSHRDWSPCGMRQVWSGQRLPRSTMPVLDSLKSGFMPTSPLESGPIPGCLPVYAVHSAGGAAGGVYRRNRHAVHIAIGIFQAYTGQALASNCWPRSKRGHVHEQCIV